ncbi:6134_t:CDS:2, partial [Gigaspora rosea]
FRTNSGYLTPLTILNDIKQLESQIVEFISAMKKKAGSEYKANSVKQAVDALKRGFGEVSGSVALNSHQVQEILQHSILRRNDPTSLLYRIFFRLSIILAMRGGEHYELKVEQFKPDEHGGFQFFRCISKNNQRGLQKGQAHIISIPYDNTGPCDDFWFYLSKRPDIADSRFSLQPESNWLDTDEIGRITKVDIPIELLSNHSGRKTAAQCLQDHDIPELELTGYKSVQGIRAYKQINKDQQLHTLNTLISLTEGVPNSNSESRAPFQEITGTSNLNSNNIDI